MTQAVNGHVTKQWAPPTKEELRTKDRAWLVLEVLWLHVLLLPSLLALLYRSLLPPKGKSLAGQVVIVTGAGRGLGRGLALRFAREGSKVAVVDFDRTSAVETAEEIVRGGGVAKAYYANVARPEDVAAMHASVVDDFAAPVDVVVNNAGLLHSDPVDSQTEKTVNSVISVNLLSHFWSAKEFLPAMRRRNSGHIVAVASMSAFQGVANITAYAASKFGLWGFMESLRDELNSTGGNKIKTTTVFPYFINTSADYTQHWNTRLPPMEIEEAVDGIIDGIKREDVCVTVPGHLYLAAQITRILPQYFRDKAREIFYVKVTPATKEEINSFPSMAIMNDLFE